MHLHRVRALLMGGQACVLYGAAEFSRDTDFAVVADPVNLGRIRRVMEELRAEVVAVPPFEARFLRKGHAIHFRSRHQEAQGMRVDLMSKMRGVDTFSALWKRRMVVEFPDGAKCDVISLPDLVRAKKTQRDKDWPMIRRLVEAHYYGSRSRASADRVRFWLGELRTPEILVEIARENREACRRLTGKRPLLRHALEGDSERLSNALREEEMAERQRDRIYWTPLRRELELLRRARVRSRSR